MRFSPATFLVIVTTVALTVVTVSQCKQRNQIRELSARLKKHENYGRIQGRINEFVRNLDLDRKEDREAFCLVRDLTPSAPSLHPHWEVAIRQEDRESFQQLIDVDGETGWLEVLSLSHRPLPHPSHDYSVNILFNGFTIVDVLIVRSTQMSNFDVEFVDDNNDGMIDLIVHRQIMFAREVSQYEITPDGFTERTIGALVE